MGCEKFEDYDPHGKTKQLLKHVNDIVNEYAKKGLDLTVRQVHYQLVSRNITKNTDANYKALTNLVKRARLAGMIDWDAIVDRNRESNIPYYNYSVQDALRSSLDCYSRDKMQFQKVYIEVMIEKMAIYEIVEQITRKYTIRLTGDKGFCSNTVLYKVAERLKEAMKQGKYAYVLYIGDHDPSGLTMDKSINDTLSLMGAKGFEFRRVALTPEQVKEYNLPPNKIKDGDRNSDSYREKHGSTSWECDALPPEILQEVLEDEILSIIDYDTYLFMCKLEKEGKETLRQMIENMGIN